MCLLIPVPFMIFTTAIVSKVSDIVTGSIGPANYIASYTSVREEIADAELAMHQGLRKY